MKNFRILYYIIGFSTLLLYNAHSQDIPSFLEADGNRFEYRQTTPQNELHKRLPDEELATPVYFRPYDVLHYDIILDWYNMMNKPMKLDANGFGYVMSDDVIWTGVVQIKIRVDTAKINEIRLDAAELKISDVVVNSNSILPTPTVLNNELIIPLSTPAYKNDILIININYTHDRFINIGSYNGFFLYPKRYYIGQIPVPPNDSVFVEERLAYTMSEPQDARYWVPCNDSPHDKATVAIRVRVPLGYSVASNGLLQRVEQNDTASTWVWYSDQVMATYLMQATASKFKVWSDWYHKVTSPNDSIEIKYFAWQKDYDGTKQDQSEYNARWTYEQNAEQIACFANAYGEYPFKKYGLVSLQPFSFGGMEHQTMTSINRVWIRQNSRNGLAHELAHMWLGDLITCKTWNDIWINEGGATFSEAIWTEHLAGRDYYFRDMLGKRAFYMAMGGSSLPPIYGLPIYSVFGNNSVLVYQKGSWVYHMLRTMLGDNVFFPALKGLLAKNGFTSMDSHDMEIAFSKEVDNPPVPFDVYFKQWLQKSGHPRFNLSVSTSNAGKDYYIATMNLSQEQPADSISDIFEVPVRIIFKSDSGAIFVDTLLQKNRIEVKKIGLPFYPASVEIDTSHILCEVASITTSVKERENIDDNLLSVNPNPVIKGSTGSVSLINSGTNPVKITMIDIYGRKVKELYNGVIDEGKFRFEFSTIDLSSGTYLILIDYGNRIISTKIQII